MIESIDRLKHLHTCTFIYCWSWCIFFEEKDVIGALALILTDGNT